MQKQSELPLIRPEPQTLFPTCQSLDEVIAQAQMEFPNQKNKVFTLLMTYHNTLLNQIN